MAVKSWVTELLLLPLLANTCCEQRSEYCWKSCCLCFANRAEKNICHASCSFVFPALLKCLIVLWRVGQIHFKWYLHISNHYCWGFPFNMVKRGEFDHLFTMKSQGTLNISRIVQDKNSIMCLPKHLLKPLSLLKQAVIFQEWHILRVLFLHLHLTDCNILWETPENRYLSSLWLLFYTH